jgi:hypothetical protein
MKEYTLQEVFEEKEGTEFEVYHNGNDKNIKNIVIIYANEDKRLYWADGEKVQLRESLAKGKFIKVQQPVSFMDVVNSNKKCKVEYELVTAMLISKDIKFDKHFIAESFRAMQKDEYIYVDEVVLVLSKYLGAKALRKVIKEGKWYLEDKVDE